jgi:hypothetical protein
VVKRYIQKQSYAALNFFRTALIKQFSMNSQTPSKFNKVVVINPSNDGTFEKVIERPKKGNFKNYIKGFKKDRLKAI